MRRKISCSKLHALPRRTIRFFMKPFIRHARALVAFAICTVISSSYSAENELADIKSQITKQHDEAVKRLKEWIGQAVV